MLCMADIHLRVSGFSASALESVGVRGITEALFEISTVLIDLTTAKQTSLINARAWHLRRQAE